jgi:hypothetical protein
MSGGGNGQAQESANLQKAHSSQSNRYGYATDVFNSPEYLSALRTKDSSGSSSNSQVCRCFGNSVSEADTYESMRLQYEKKMKQDSEEAQKINNNIWSSVFGKSSKA